MQLISRHELAFVTATLDYGFEIGGIIGMDFLRAAHAIVDLGNLTIEFA